MQAYKRPTPLQLRTLYHLLEAGSYIEIYETRYSMRYGVYNEGGSQLMLLSRHGMVNLLLAEFIKEFGTQYIITKKGTAYAMQRKRGLWARLNQTKLEEALLCQKTRLKT